MNVKFVRMSEYTIFMFKKLFRGKLKLNKKVVFFALSPCFRRRSLDAAKFDLVIHSM